MPTVARWPGWVVSNCTNCTTATTATSYNVTTAWQIWTNQTTAYNNAAAIYVWPEWAQTYAAMREEQIQALSNAQGALAGIGKNVNVQPKISEERRRGILEERERWRKIQEEATAKAAAALKRAEALLLACLTDEQKHELVTDKRFNVVTPSGKRYRIKRHTHGNVLLLDDHGEPVRRYCAQPGGVPDDDAILAQVLALRTDEAAFLRVANETILRAG